MATLTLRDIDETIVDAIKTRATANARTVEAEAEVLLAQAVGATPAAIDPWAEVRRIAAMTPKGVPQTDSVVMLREDRER